MDQLLSLFDQHIFSNPAFSSAIFSGRDRSGFEDEWKKITIKPVLLKDVLHYQFNYYDNLKGITKNHPASVAKGELSKIAALGFKNFYIRDDKTGIQIQITKKGTLLVKKHKETAPATTDLRHDRQKQRLIDPQQDSAYLQALGLADEKGQIKPSMQAKFRQINEFIKVIASLTDWKDYNEAIHLIDCGAGNAYLTFATYHYFRHALAKDMSATGIDIDPTSVQNNKTRVATLDWDSLDFEVSNIIGYQPGISPTITMALHACDTATDEALLKGILWQSKFIIAVPCCHHHLQVQLKKAEPQAATAGLFNHAILRERLGDVLTDSLRALLLQIMGYQTEIIQFVSPDHTAKNLLIRAEKISDQPLPHSLDHYRDLKALWQVKPRLEELLLKTTDLSQRLS